MTTPSGQSGEVSYEILVDRSLGRPRRSTWIIVCESLHGAVGPIPTEELAIELAAEASSISRCNYRPVALAVATGRDRVAGRLTKRGTPTSEEDDTRSRKEEGNGWTSTW
jgi:hypothetical protein